MLLDGHFCLLDALGNITKISLDVFAAMQPAAVLLVTAEPETVHARLMQRNAESPPLDVVAQLSNREEARAVEVSTTLAIPMWSVRGDIELDVAARSAAGWVLDHMTHRGAILSLAIGVLLSAAADAARAERQDADRNPDRLYADRAQLDRALEAAAIWEGRLTGGRNDFEAAWKLARACYWLGGHVPANERKKQYERGVAAGKRAIDIDTARPEGHFWMAANMGTLAESFGLRAGLRYRGPVRRELETVLRIDPSYGEGLADRALGRWYLRVPGMFGGSKKKSVEHLQRALTYDESAAATHLFLAETYLAMDRREEAATELQRVLDAPLHSDWVPEVGAFKQRATALLAAIQRR